MRAPRLLAALLTGLLPLAACADDSPRADPASSTDAASIEGTVTVLAAASLRAAFTHIAAAFESAHDGVKVVVSFDGSARLATAIVEGAPADVFASADEANMQKVVQAGGVEGAPVVIATNVLQIVVPAGNPLTLRGLADLARGGLRVSLCRAEVPCGHYAVQAFEQAALTVPRVGDQESVAGVLAQVQLGEADAGLVYRTDVLAADGVEGLDLAEAAEVQAVYPVAWLAEGPNPAAAAAFVEYLQGDEAQAILRARGFGGPPNDGSG